MDQIGHFFKACRLSSCTLFFFCTTTCSCWICCCNNNSSKRKLTAKISSDVVKFSPHFHHSYENCAVCVCFSPSLARNTHTISPTKCARMYLSILFCSLFYNRDLIWIEHRIFTISLKFISRKDYGHHYDDDDSFISIRLYHNTILLLFSFLCLLWMLKRFTLNSVHKHFISISTIII